MPSAVPKTVMIPPDLRSSIRPSETKGETTWSVCFVACFQRRCVAVTSPRPPPRTARRACQVASAARRLAASSRRALVFTFALPVSDRS